MRVAGMPHDFPVTGALDPRRVALLVIDMQRDFCDPEGYMHQRGEDIAATRAIVPKIAAVLTAARTAGMLRVFTREGHRSSLSDLPETKRLKTARAGAEIGSLGVLGRLLIRGEHGWDFIDELQPEPDEVIIDKLGTGAFFATELDAILRRRRIEQLILTGVTTGVCVTSTAREAADRGYDVLVLEDCCAEPDAELHRMAVRLLQIEGGYLASVSNSAALLSTLAELGATWNNSISGTAPG